MGEGVVKIRPQFAYSRSRWLVTPLKSGAYRPWLVERGSLTKRLQSKTQYFHVRALHVHHHSPYLDEARLLGLPPHQQALLREVMLMDDQIPLVFAHSVLPHKSLRGPWQGLSKMGNRPLGAALFADHRVVRTPLQYKKIAKHHVLFRQVAKYLGAMPPAIWARRSIFQLRAGDRQHAIMVTEVFLPAVLGLK